MHQYVIDIVYRGLRLASLSFLCRMKGISWLGFRLGRLVDLIWKVAHPVKLLVGQWVSMGGFAFETLLILMQIGLGWVALKVVGLG